MSALARLLPGKPDSTVTELEELARQARASRFAFEPVWFLNLAYLEGQQWLQYGRGGKFYQPPLRPTATRPVDNRILPAVQTEVAKMTKNRPVFDVTPNTGGEDDLDAARIGGLILDDQWVQLDLRRKLERALRWSRSCSAGFWKITWDKTLGDGFQVLVDPQGDPIIGPDGRHLRPDDPAAGPVAAALAQSHGLDLKTKSINEGRVRVEVRSPFQMLVDPLAELLSDCEWVIEETVLSKEKVRDRWGVDLTPDTDANPGLVQARMGTGVGPAPQGKGTYRGVKVSEYWAGRSHRFPNGRRAVWAQGKLLEEDTNPFDVLPYVMFTGIPVPGRFWPTSTVEQLRDPQTRLNKANAQIDENAVKIGNPKPMLPRGANVDLKAFSDPGAPIMYDDLGGPASIAYLQAPPLPQYVTNRLQDIQLSIQEISGQHEVNSGTVPAGVTAASAINLLQEADDTRLGPAITDMEGALGEAGEKILKLLGKFATSTQTIRISGEDDQWMIFDFKGAMLKGNTAVSVQAGSAFPRSKAAKQAAIMQALTLFVQNNIPLDMRNLAKVLRDLEVGGMERMLAQFTDDQAQVNRENHRLGMGEPVLINPFDNDQDHVDGHTDFQKTARYEKLPPEVKQICESHVDAHRARLQAQAPPDPAQAQMVSQLAGQQGQQAAQGAQADQQLASSQAQAVHGLATAQASHEQKLTHAQQQHEAQLARAQAQAKAQPQSPAGGQ